jgi:diamine N-acetyltransferase
MYTHKNNITLRLLEHEDLLDMKLLKDESWFGTHTITFKNMKQQINWYENLDNSKSMFFVAYNEKNEKVGVYKIQNIDWISRSYDSGHDVFKEHRGLGYGKLVLEAGIDFGFEILNMNRINMEILVNNVASFKTSQYVGFVQEGIKRKTIFKCGEYIDSVVLGIIREDWQNLKRVKNYNGLCNISYTPKK